MDKKVNVKKIVLTVLIAIVIAVSSFGLGFFVRSRAYQPEIDTLNYILSMYRKYYYEESDDVVELFERSLLDQYSDYYTPEEYELITKASVGSHEGIGLTYNSQTLEISEITWNSPCDRAGVRAGGIITGVKAPNADEYTALQSGANLSEIIGAIPARTDFKLRVDYGGQTVEHTLAREEYTETYARYYDDGGEYGVLTEDREMVFKRVGDNDGYDLEGRTDVGVIRYRAFNGLKSGLWGSAGQFKRAIEQFSENGKKNLILDLRSNGGGFLDVLGEVAAHLVEGESGKKVAVVIERDKHERETVYNSAPLDSAKYGCETITILVDSGSASASEALVGAILDYDASKKVKVVIEGYVDNNGGRVYRSYGKGIMQTTYENFLTGGAIKLTTAKLFWPKSGICIHNVAITEKLNDEEYFSDAKRVYNAGYDENSRTFTTFHDALSLSASSSVE